MFDLFLSGLIAWTTPEVSEGPFLEWKQQLDPNIPLDAEYAKVLVHENKIYIGTSSSSELQILERSTGVKIGSISTHAAVQIPPVISNQRMYFADISGTVYAYDLNTDTIVWEKKTNTPIMSELLLLEDSLIFSTVNNIIYRLSTENSLIWRYQYEPSVSRSKELSIFGSSSPYLGTDYLLVGFSDGAMEKIELATGTVKDKLWIGEGRYPDIVSKISGTDSVIVASGFEGPTVAFSPDLFDELWSRDIGRASDLLFDNETMYIAQSNGVLSAVDVLSGAMIWNWSSGKNTNLTSPVLYKEHLYFGSVEGSIFKIHQETGTLVWTFEMEKSVLGFSAPISIVDDQLLVIGNDRILYSFSLEENADMQYRKGKIETNQTMFLPTVVE